MDEKLALLGGKPVLEKPFPPFNSLGSQEKAAVERVMDSGVLSDFLGRAGDQFLGGSEVRLLESKIEEMFQVKSAVSFNSATTALQAAVGALGIGPGDEVITSPYTMSATASAILLNGAVPVFADIDPDSFCLDPKSVAKNISPRTKAIMAVNIFGGGCDYKTLIPLAKEHGLKVIEDNAQAIGATQDGAHLGTIGDAGVLSFNYHKTVQCGEGGVLMTNDENIARRAQLIRNHGEVVIDDLREAGDDIDEPVVGSNYRLSELHAAIASEQLKKMEQLNAPRIELAEYLSEKMARFKWLTPPWKAEGSTHVYYVYAFKFDAAVAGMTRKAFASAMGAEGFPLSQGYVKPIYLMPVYKERRMFPRSGFPFEGSTVPYVEGICPVAERMYREELLLTSICNGGRTKKDIDLFVSAIAKVESQKESLKDYEK